MPPPIRLIVGLGNPGAEYAESRHNAGFWFVDSLAGHNNASLRLQAKFHGEVCRVSAGGRDVWLLKPVTMMNRSGRSVSSLANYYRIPPEEILVVHDELDLDAGTVRLKRGGGHAGHNGLRDIISAVGNSDFWRMRVGISRPAGISGQRLVNYVLGRPSREETSAIEDAIARAEPIVGDLLAGDFQKAMHRLHGTG